MPERPPSKDRNASRRGGGSVRRDRPIRSRLRAAQQFCLQILLAATALAVPGAGRADADGRPVALELVLTVDVSASVSDPEYRLQMRGIAEALRDPDVAASIAAYGDAGVALTMVQWSRDARQVIPWVLLTGAESAAAVAGRIERLPRIALGVTTAIGTAIALSRQLIADNAYAGQRRSIDVSGDGMNNDGLPIWHERQRTMTDGITINGLAIVNGDSRLDAYYRDHVIGGLGAFMITADDFEDFQRAFREKLLREIRSMVADNEPRAGPAEGDS